jgi:23S rRNA (uracil1939-C5)-methyltransferase
MRKHQRKDGRLPRNAPPLEVVIDHIGARGDGVGRATYTHNYATNEHQVFVPATLPTERVLVQPLSLSSQGIKARIIEFKDESQHRQSPSCNAFPACGGCSFQHWHPDSISQWKQDQVVHFLERADVWPGTIRPLHSSPLASRRRATFHIKRLANDVVAGFHERQGERIVYPDACTILHPDLAALLAALRQIAHTHFPVGVTVDALANMLDQGICLRLAINAGGKSDPALERSPAFLAALGEWAAGSGLARLSLLPSGAPGTPAIPLFAPIPPTLRFGEVTVTPPAGAFLQASHDGEAQLQAAVAEITDGAKSVADLFAGCGTLSLPLLGRLTRLLAAEQDKEALACLKAGADAIGLGARVIAHDTDLANAPLTPDQLTGFEAVIIDPPRGGAAAQCAQLPLSNVPRIAMVSCNPATFARDAALLCDGGFSCDWLQIIDQFRMSNHIEIVAQFSRIG